MIIILQLQYVALPFIEKKGPYSWQSLLVLQQQFLLYSLVTDLQCYSGSHAPSPKGWAMIHLKAIKETPLLLTSGVCPTSVHVPYFWPNRHKGGFFCDTEKKNARTKISHPLSSIPILCGEMVPRGMAGILQQVYERILIRWGWKCRQMERVGSFHWYH